MSVPPKRPQPDAPEGREAFEEEASHGSLAPSAELEEALREAAEAVEGAGARGRPPTQGMRVGEGVKLPSEENRELHEEVERLGAELEQARGELAREEERAVRLAADFDNFRKRNLREREEAHRYGHENLVKDLLGAVDNLDRAVDHARRSGGADFESILQGVELVQRELQGVLSKHGVTRIEAAGEPFDPTVHEAVAQQEEGSVPANTVVQVYQPGYRLWDRLLRPARVVVSKPPSDGGSGEGGAER
ncbi:MAG TPA: nucleotide exchange factor GrpE [Myxococcota bacterium]|nr:nucleotide exchange factor GrpE [Myxococcota bacterium]